MRVGVALLNWNGGEFTLPCIRSVLTGSVRPWRVVVVDNGSTDGSPDRIAKAYPDVRVMRSTTNLGFTGGNNVAIRTLLQDGADLVWILNNDTIVDRECLANLIAGFDGGAEIGAVTGKILFEEPADRIWYGGARWRAWAFSVSHIGYGERDRGQHDVDHDVSFASGCCILASRACLADVGLLDDRYFAYWEDAEWSFRARSRGWRLRYAARATLRHRVSASLLKNTLAPSGGTASPFAHYLNQRNRLLFARQHARRPFQLCTSLLWTGVRTLYLAGGLAVLRRWDKLASLLRGTRDGLRMSVT